MPIFLKVPNIKGTVHDAGPDFNDCILIESCDIEVTREVTEGTGAAKNREFRAPVISAIERVSRPGCRVYVGQTEIPRVLGGLGINILTTPRGVMTGRDAHKERVGGEILCRVW